MVFKPSCLATAIGSMPHTSAEEATQIVLKTFSEIPVWPQLPKVSFKEKMFLQYVEGMPAVVIDDAKEEAYFDTTGNFEKEMEEFYRKYLKDDAEEFAITSDFAQGFYTFLETLKKENPAFQILKGQVTGPVSLGFALLDEAKRPSLYNETLADAIVKTLGRKGRWQEEKFKQAFPEAQTLIFIDEPTLMCYGAAFFSLDRAEVIRLLNEVLGELTGLSGIHCCGNTDWGMLAETNATVISFDAYSYAKNLSLFTKELKEFLERGGVLAWGIVPTEPQKIAGENKESLVEKLEEKINLLVKEGFKKEDLLEASLITPSCGTGSMPPDKAEKALELTKAVSEAMRAKYFRESN